MCIRQLPQNSIKLHSLLVFVLVALLLTPSSALYAQRELVLNTTGYGFDRTASNGINPGQWEYILKFANLKYGSKDASPTAVRLHVQWEQYEPTAGNYQREKIVQAVKAILDINPSMKVALHFSYLRPGYWNDSYISSSDVPQLSNGTLMRDAIAHTYGSIFSEFSTGKFLAFVDDALTQVQSYSSRILYVAMGNNGSEEFYMPNKTVNSVNYAAMFEEKASQAWRTKFLPARFPGQSTVTWGRNSYQIANAPLPTDGNYNSEIGRDFHRFAGWGLLKLFKGFYQTVKNRNSSIKVLHFISDFGTSQGNSRHLHSSTLVLALELSDGIYHTDGTSMDDLWRKILGVDCIKGTYPNKIAAVEFDPMDLGQPNGGSGIYASIGLDWLPRAFKHGAEYVHIAMHFNDSEMAQLAPALAACREQFIKPSYQPPARAEAVTVNIYPNVFTGQSLFDLWGQIGGNDFSKSDLQPKSIRMTDAGYWEKVWDNEDYLPCTFSVNVNTSQPEPIVGTQVSLSVNCSGPECNSASYVWNGQGINNKTGNSVTFDAPSTVGNYNYSATSTRSGCMPKNSTLSLKVTSGLPVKLVRFTATKEKSQALLAWATSEEVNSEKFEIERSQDGKRWVKVGTVAASGDTRQTVDYNFTDISPIHGANLYRLKMIDLDKTFAYSRIVSLNFFADATLATYPNPATEKVIVAADNWEAVRTLRIINQSGQTVYSSDKPAQEINVEKLATGVYVIALEKDNGSLENVKFVKQAGK